MDQTELLIQIGAILDAIPARYAVVGSIASMLYAEPRLTLDIDIVVELEEDNIDALCDSFPAPEFYVSKPAAHQAVVTRGQFNILHLKSGNKIDLMIAKSTAWTATQLGRVRRLAIAPGSVVSVASPEDVILGKLWYYSEGGSEKHLRDITSMLISHSTIDRAYINHWARELNVVEPWEAVLKRLANQ